MKGEEFRVGRASNSNLMCCASWCPLVMDEIHLWTIPVSWGVQDFLVCGFRAMPISVPIWRSRFRSHADHD
jgi:hypothetical protein